MVMDMYARIWSSTLVLLTLIGLVQCLDCYTCDWNVKNDTMESGCLGAPYNTPSIACPVSTSTGERYMCQTHAEFEVKSGVMSLVSLERKCGLKHLRCNNACAQDSTDCWMCCNDNSNCNGFPLRSNLVVITSSAQRQQPVDIVLSIFVTMWLLVTCI